MRLGQAIFFGAAAALLTLAAPTLARNSSTNSHYGEGNRGARGRHLPCLSAGGRRLVDATALSGDGSKASAQPHSAAKSATEETQ